MDDDDNTAVNAAVSLYREHATVFQEALEQELQAPGASW